MAKSWSDHKHLLVWRAIGLQPVSFSEPFALTKAIFNPFDRRVRFPDAPSKAINTDSIVRSQLGWT
ncbi:hypothetical protein M4951_08840 [Blastopirellula sp. J2-11]|uniref:hypothetical protein n=1 Tax=Blastopirellula sp. J2-11 TaxID=2943192 RepID=UPI0021CA6AFC|nr:hypothetical protein [Blastopirellula sp. J2-11]UUO08408.1 hypothetical protein M4951_08840 [Blastopirellula sp. J2-11]